MTGCPTPVPERFGCSENRALGCLTWSTMSSTKGNPGSVGPSVRDAANQPARCNALRRRTHAVDDRGGNSTRRHRTTRGRHQSGSPDLGPAIGSGRRAATAPGPVPTVRRRLCPELTERSQAPSRYGSRLAAEVGSVGCSSQRRRRSSRMWPPRPPYRPSSVAFPGDRLAGQGLRIDRHPGLA